MSVPTQLRPKVRLGGLAGSSLVVATLLLGGALGGCASSDHDMTTSPPPTASVPSGGEPSEAPAASEAPDATPAMTGHVAPAGGTMTAGGHPMPTAEEIAATWGARPDYVHAAHPMVQDAYAYALERPDVIEWMPCYCGCGAMAHDSNLDCFFKPRGSGEGLVFEEHASYCDICVETALMARQMMGKGRPLTEIRATIDAMYSANGVPGTPTELPPG